VARARGYFRLLGICVRPQVPAQPTLYLPYSSAIQISIGQQGNPDLPTFWSSILKKMKKTEKCTVVPGNPPPRPTAAACTRRWPVPAVLQGKCTAVTARPRPQLRQNTRNLYVTASTSTIIE